MSDSDAGESKTGAPAAGGWKVRDALSTTARSLASNAMGNTTTGIVERSDAALGLTAGRGALSPPAGGGSPAGSPRAAASPRRGSAVLLAGKDAEIQRLQEKLRAAERDKTLYLNENPHLKKAEEEKGYGNEDGEGGGGGTAKQDPASTDRPGSPTRGVHRESTAEPYNLPLRSNSDTWSAQFPPRASTAGGGGDGSSAPRAPRGATEKQRKLVPTALEVTVLQAKRLVGLSKKKLSNPYAFVTVSSSKSDSAKTERTKTLPKTCHPRWGQRFQFPIPVNRAVDVTVTLHSEEWGNPFLGEVRYTLDDPTAVLFAPSQEYHDLGPRADHPKDQEFMLKKGHASHPRLGEIELMLRAQCPANTALPDPETLVPRNVELTVVGASDLKLEKKLKKAEVYAEVTATGVAGGADARRTGLMNPMATSKAMQQRVWDDRFTYMLSRRRVGTHDASDASSDGHANHLASMSAPHEQITFCVAVKREKEGKRGAAGESIPVGRAELTLSAAAVRDALLYPRKRKLVLGQDGVDQDGALKRIQALTGIGAHGFLFLVVRSSLRKARLKNDTDVGRPGGAADDSESGSETTVPTESTDDLRIPASPKRMSSPPRSPAAASAADGLAVVRSPSASSADATSSSSSTSSPSLSYTSNSHASSLTGADMSIMPSPLYALRGASGGAAGALANAAATAAAAARGGRASLQRTMQKQPGRGRAPVFPLHALERMAKPVPFAAVPKFAPPPAAPLGYLEKRKPTEEVQAGGLSALSDGARAASSTPAPSRSGDADKDSGDEAPGRGGTTTAPASLLGGPGSPAAAKAKESIVREDDADADGKDMQAEGQDNGKRTGDDAQSGVGSPKGDTKDATGSVAAGSDRLGDTAAQVGGGGDKSEGDEEARDGDAPPKTMGETGDKAAAAGEAEEDDDKGDGAVARASLASDVTQVWNEIVPVGRGRGGATPDVGGGSRPRARPRSPPAFSPQCWRAAATAPPPHLGAYLASEHRWSCCGRADRFAVCAGPGVFDTIAYHTEKRPVVQGSYGRQLADLPI